MKFAYLPMILGAASLTACSQVVAPDYKGPKSQLDSTDGRGASAATGGRGSTGGTSNSTTTGSSNSNTTGSSNNNTAASNSGGTIPLGTVQNEITDISGFRSKSAYMVAATQEGMTAIILDSQTVTEKMQTSRIIGYEDCKPTDELSDGLMFIAFFKDGTASLAGYKVDNNGFPKQNANDVADQPLNGMEVSFIPDRDSSVDMKSETGMVTFASGFRPAKVGDLFKANVNIALPDGKKYKADISGKVFDFIESQVERPTCPEGQLARPIYQ